MIVEGLSFPRLCGLLAASPSTLSQAMHNAGFKALGLPFTYVAFDTRETEAALKAMRKLGIRGFSLTIPHKERALGMVDALGKDAERIGAINTVINDGGRLTGYNSDWFGVVEALREAEYTPRGGAALVLGAGGAARAALYALQELGCRKVFVSNRTEKRAVELAGVFPVQHQPWSSLPSRDFSEFELIVNSTAIGLPLAGKAAGFPFSWDVLSERHTVFDMITKDTELLSEARIRGAAAVPGVRMLLHQAVRQFELFTESSAPLDVMEAALTAEISKSTAQAGVRKVP